MFLLYIISYAIDPFIWIHAYYTVFTPKYREKGYYVGAFLGLYAIIIVKQIMTFRGVGIASIAFFPIMFAYIIIISNLLFKGTFKANIYLFIIIYIVSIIVDCLVGGLWIISTNAANDEYAAIGILNLGITISARTVNLICYRFLLPLLSKNKLFIKWKGMYATVLFNIATVIPLLIIFYNIIGSKSEILLLALGVELLIAVLFSLYIAYTIYQKSRIQDMKNKKIEEMKSQLAFYEEKTESIKNLRKLRHDMKSHISQIMRIAKEENSSNVINYINALYLDIDIADEICTIDNLFLASIITEKKKHAGKKGITFQSEITVSIFPLTNQELTSLFANILDNALEATDRIQDGRKKYVDLEIFCEKEIVHIICKNSFAERPKRDKKGNYVTSKENRTNHGMGMLIIKDIVVKYSGEMTTFYDAEEFILSISFRNSM
ncbi:sensor histidine kinase [Anaeromicropila populeti]|nr:GHKL domain-containing protein [Anaeromicropila populeti]